jgi:hypothetical protein
MRGRRKVLKAQPTQEYPAKMVSPPELHSEIYDAVDPKHFKDSQKGKVVLVIGI